MGWEVGARDWAAAAAGSEALRRARTTASAQQQMCSVALGLCYPKACPEPLLIWSVFDRLCQHS